MKKILFILSAAILGIAFPLKAQFLSDINGRPILETKYTNVEGSPYLLDDWTEGVVKLKNGTSYKEIKLKYDQVADELLFNHKGQALTFVDPVQEFKIVDGSTERLFRAGVTSNDKGRNSFYEVLYDGGTKLVRKRGKEIVENKPYNSATTTRTFVPVESLYIMRDNQVIKIKKDKKSVLSVLGDKAPKLESYIKEKKLNLKDEADIARLVEHYNSL